MTDKELIKFLKENLKVKVNTVHSYMGGSYLRVELYIGKERIDCDEVCLD